MAQEALLARQQQLATLAESISRTIAELEASAQKLNQGELCGLAAVFTLSMPPVHASFSGVAAAACIVYCCQLHRAH